MPPPFYYDLRLVEPNYDEYGAVIQQYKDQNPVLPWHQYLDDRPRLRVNHFDYRNHDHTNHRYHRDGLTYRGYHCRLASDFRQSYWDLDYRLLQWGHHHPNYYRVF